MPFYPGDLVTCTGDRVNYAEHEKFGRVGSDFFCLLCKNISLLAEVSHGVKKKNVPLVQYWRLLAFPLQPVKF